jgi:hypothetical protein
MITTLFSQECWNFVPSPSCHLLKMGRKRLAYLTASLLLLVLLVAMASTSQSLETEGCK